jgi:hypothetical protein
VPRLSAAAREELRALKSIITGTDLSAEPKGLFGVLHDLGLHRTNEPGSPGTG